MKKFICMVLVSAMLISCIGCGSAGNSEVANAENAAVDSSATESAAAVEENVTEADDEATENVAETEAVEGDAADEEATEEAVEEEVEEYSIKDLFAEHGIKAGTCLSASMIGNTKQKDLILSQFSSVTMENAMKPENILEKDKSREAGDIVVEFNSDVIKMLDFAKENGLGVRGHTIVWYSQTPEWIFHEGFDIQNDLVSRDVMLARLESMIKQIFGLIEEGGYSDIFYAYDVANECWMEDGTMRECKWKEVIGDDYLWYAFKYADTYAPENIDLYYNDYNEQFKTQALVSFVDTLKDEDGEYLIDGIGLQAHLYTSDNQTLYFRTVDALAQTGLKVEVTELDVCLGAYQDIKPATEDNLKAQGKFYYNIIRGLLDRVDAGTLNMDAITFWGFADSLSWRKEYSPLLYDMLYTPKYAYYGAMQISDKAGFKN